ncbi:SPOR domain-containing protein [Pseudomonas cremoricolorata]|uniref:SPOR domain-containing protein n=1 Tax=Pseudomonas cremoricolorata TaxID=157783 RepID=UPI000426AC44|nr:SPOR domain-containing protein [Pseudomonas cremoricolorata]
MALLDKGVKQRMVGALVLVALAVVFLPMLFTRQDELREVRVEAPAAPQAAAQPDVQVEPVAVPEPQALPDEPVQAPVVVNESTAPVTTPSQPITPSPQAQSQAAKPQQQAQPQTQPQSQPAQQSAPAAQAPANKTAAASKVDGNGLPVSWSIQLASLSSRAGADKLQSTLRSKGYNAYIRTADGLNRVYVGPVIERAEADRLRDVINRQHQLKGFVVRFQPERG